MKLKLIPAGSFLMGSPDSEMGREKDEIQHKVTLTEPFYIGVYEVTQEQYEKVMCKNPLFTELYIKALVGPEKPVASVSWFDAKTFCKKLSKIENREYRLPTEAEWEYACRAGTETPFYWGDSFDEKFAWCAKKFEERSQEVGSFQPNAWGLFDMCGNVSEWCEDWMEDYPVGEQVNPKGPDHRGQFRVIRGGSWASNNPKRGRSAYRSCWGPEGANFDIGFRVVAVPAASQ